MDEDFYIGDRILGEVNYNRFFCVAYGDIFLELTYEPSRL